MLMPETPFGNVVSRSPVTASTVNSPVLDEANSVTSASVNGVAWAVRFATSISGCGVEGSIVAEPDWKPVAPM